MKAIGIIGRPRKGGNTEIVTRHALVAVAAEGIDTEVIRLCELEIKGCNACGVCEKEENCPVDDDLLAVYNKMKAADAIILASPVYLGATASEMQALLNRTCYIANHNGKPFRGKVGGLFVTAGRAGQVFAMAQIALWFLDQGCHIAGSSGWTYALGHSLGEVKKDKYGMLRAWDLGKGIALLTRKISA